MDGLSTDHIHKTIGNMFDFPLSQGTVINKIQKCAELVSPVMSKIQDKLIHSPIVNFDETGVRVDGKTKWVHSSCSYIDSARKHGVNAFEAVKLAFVETPSLCFGF